MNFTQATVYILLQTMENTHPVPITLPVDLLYQEQIKQLFHVCVNICHLNGTIGDKEDITQITPPKKSLQSLQQVGRALGILVRAAQNINSNNIFLGQ